MNGAWVVIQLDRIEPNSHVNLPLCQRSVMIYSARNRNDLSLPRLRGVVDDWFKLGSWTQDVAMSTDDDEGEKTWVLGY